MKNLNKNLISLSVIFLVVLVFSLISPTETNAYPTIPTYCVGCEPVAPVVPTVPLPQNLVPVINTLSPNTVTEDSGAREVIIDGLNFAPNSIARWNSSDRPTSFISSTRVIMQLSAVDVQNTGEFLISVVNSNPAGGAFSNTKVFTVKAKSTGTVAGASTAKKATTTKKVVKAEEEDPIVCMPASTLANIAENGGDGTNKNGLTAAAFFGDKSFLPNTFIEWLLLAVLIYFGIKLYRKVYITEAERNKPLKHA